MLFCIHLTGRLLYLTFIPHYKYLNSTLAVPGGDIDYSIFDYIFLDYGILRPFWVGIRRIRCRHFIHFISVFLVDTL